MGVRTKTLFTVLLVGVVVGVIAMQVENKELFKGQIFEQPGTEENVEENASKLLPDLKPSIVVEAPAEGEEDIVVNATIENIGQGEIDGTKPFKYTIYINDEEAFSNTDSYSTMAPADSFSFSYPISRKIYEYGDQGQVKFVLDTENNVEEENEENNETVSDYKF